MKRRYQLEGFWEGSESVSIFPTWRVRDKGKEKKKDKEGNEKINGKEWIRGREREMKMKWKKIWKN